jgi:hypothetical protein
MNLLRIILFNRFLWVQGFEMMLWHMYSKAAYLMALLDVVVD